MAEPTIDKTAQNSCLERLGRVNTPQKSQEGTLQTSIFATTGVGSQSISSYIAPRLADVPLVAFCSGGKKYVRLFDEGLLTAKQLIGVFRSLRLEWMTERDLPY